MQAIYEDYQTDAFMVFSIGVDATEVDCANWITTHGLTHPVLSDDDVFDSVVFPLFGSVTPHTVLLDTNMEVVYTAPGIIDEMAMRALIDANLPAQPDVPATGPIGMVAMWLV